MNVIAWDVINVEVMVREKEANVWTGNRQFNKVTLAKAAEKVVKAAAATTKSTPTTITANRFASSSMASDYQKLAPLLGSRWQSVILSGLWGSTLTFGL